MTKQFTITITTQKQRDFLDKLLENNARLLAECQQIADDYRREMTMERERKSLQINSEQPPTI